MLDRPIVGRNGPYVWLRRAEGEVGMGFQKVAEAKAGKNRVHLDLSGPDVVTLWKRAEPSEAVVLPVSKMEDFW